MRRPVLRWAASLGIGASVVCLSGAAMAAARPLKVLAVGNSYAFSVHEQLPQVAEACGNALDLCVLWIGGSTLFDHACCANRSEVYPTNRPYEVFVSWTSLPKWTFAAKANLQEVLVAEKWDIVTFQQASHESWNSRTYHPFGEQLVELTKKLAPQAEVVLQETWADQPESTRLKRWNLTSETMYAAIRWCYADFAKMYDSRVIPMGTAVELARGIGSLQRDGGNPHLRPRGEYLQALVWTAKLFGANVRRCPYVPDWLKPDEAAALQDAAMRAVGGEVPAYAVYDPDRRDVPTMLKDRPMPHGKDATRPYEIVWAGRTADEVAPLLPLTDAKGWTVRASQAEASFDTSCIQKLFGDSTCKFVGRAVGKDPRVILVPPKTVRLNAGVDTVSCWFYGPGWGVPNPLTFCVNFRDAKGEPFQVKLPRVGHGEWFVLRARLTDEQRGRVATGGVLESLSVEGLAEKAGTVFLNSLCVYREDLKPLRFRPRPKRPNRVFPQADVGTNTGPGELPFPNLSQGIVPTAEPTADLRFRLPKKATDWRDLAFSWKGGDWVCFAEMGGVFFDEGGKVPVLCEETRLTIVTNAVSPLDIAYRVVQRDKDGRLFGSSVRFQEMGRSLVVDVTSEGEVSEVRFGGWRKPAGELLKIPYLTYAPWGGDWRPRVVATQVAGRPFFHLAMPDWYQSNATKPVGGVVYEDRWFVSNTGVVYEKKTDGRRNQCFERFVYSFSDRFEDVLPNIPNPKSPWMHVAGKGVWRSHGVQDRAKDLATWRTRHARGLRHMIITDHETCMRDGWESFTFRTEPAPQKGGNKGMYDYARTMIDELGYRYGPYNNYCDIAPVNANWSADRAIRLSDMTLQTAWDRCYAPKPAYVVEACEDIVPRLQGKFRFNTAYCDVHTSPSPWWRVDYDSRVPGAGTFAATFFSWGEIMLIQKRTWNGPVYSEGGVHHLYAGLTDGNYAQDMSYGLPENPWIVDYDLLRIHPLCCNFGMGSPGMFYENVPRPKDDDVAIDRFLAATVAFGHPGFLATEGEKYENRSYFMVQALAALYTQAKAVDIRYLGEDGKAYPTSAALLNGAYKRSQIEVAYSDGTRIAVNGSKTEPMEIGNGIVLPPNGYFGQGKDVFVFSGLRAGHRVDFVVSPEYVFMDGRGVETSFPGGVAREQIIRLRENDKTPWPVPRVSDFKM